MRARQSGTTIVEFAIIGALFFTVLFAVIEFGRLLFTWNTLTEATRRGARVAAVCPVPPPQANVDAIKCAALFNPSGGLSCTSPCAGSPIFGDLNLGNINVQYLDTNAVTLAPNADVTLFFNKIRYVKVSITGYVYTMLIPPLLPGLNIAPFTAPSFETTLPRESLGTIPGP